MHLLASGHAWPERGDTDGDDTDADDTGRGTTRLAVRMDTVTSGDIPDADEPGTSAPDRTVIAEDTQAVEALTTGEQVTVPLTRVTAPVDATPDVRYAYGAAQVPPAASDRGWLSPTLTDIRARLDNDPEPDSDHDRGDRSGRRRWWIAAAVAVVLIVGGVITIAQARSHGSPATDSVRRYFDDLAAGDVVSAMSLVAAADTYTRSADPLLSPTALSGIGDRPTHVAITGTAATASDGRSATAVSVTYSVGGTTAHQTIVAVGPTDPPSGPYLLVSPFITVSVTGAGSRAVSVNAVALPAGTIRTLAFPAAYLATTPGTQLLSPSTATAAYDSAAGAVEARLSLSAPTLAAGATGLVQTAVNRALDGCAASTAAAPPDCPFRYSDSSATMAWKIVTYPHVHVSLNGDVISFDDAGHTGTVHYDATTSYLFGLFPHTDSGSTTADATGTASADHGGVTVTFAGR